MRMAPAVRRGAALVVVLMMILWGATALLRDEGAGQKLATPHMAPDVPVTAMDLGFGAANNSPRILADPTEPAFLVLANRLDAPNFGCALQVSGDGGRGWQTANPVPDLPSGAEKCYGPEIAFDRNGTLYYLFVGLKGVGNEPMGVFLTKSGDRGRTFSAPKLVLGPLNFAVRMEMDPTRGRSGRLHLVWIHATSDPPLGGFGPPPNPILAAHSDDGGQTLSEPVQVNDSSRQLVVAPALTLSQEGDVYVAYYDLQEDVRDYAGLEGPTWEGTWALVLARSSDNGGSFEPGVIVDDGIVPSERVMLTFTMPPPTLASYHDAVCAAWSDSRHGDADIFLRCSPDRGGTWESFHRLNDDDVANGARQYLPALAISPEGRLDVIFYDRRDDPHNVWNHVYYTYSVDGGRSFAENVKITRYPSHSQIGPEYAGPAAEGQVELGSRNALLSDRERVVASWADTRNSRAGTTSQDLFATVIDHSSSTPQGAPGLSTGALLAGLGILVLVAAGTASKRESSRKVVDATDSRPGAT